MAPNSRRSDSCQAGFTLVEIMVGLAIGMLATIIIIQVMSVFEAQRRTTAGTADAQTNGAIALYNAGRELQMAGYPLVPVTDSPLECITLTVNGAADPTIPNRLSPVAITNGVPAAGVSASDTITIRYGDSPTGGVPTQTGQILTAGAVPVAVAVVSNLGCQANDVSVITQGTACAMSNVTAVTGTTVGNMKVTLANTPAAPAQVNLACLGTWHEVTYRVNGGNLERCDLPIAIAKGGNCNLVVPNANFVPSVAGIVNLQAQYGISATANSNQITQWVDAVDGLASGNWGANLTVVNRNRIKAIRIAVVARNAKIETGVVTDACSSTTAAAPTGLCAWEGSAASPAPAVDLSAGDPTNWARYRYRVFETIVPLRNMVWSKDTL